MEEVIQSVGIDIGTTTTQLIISEITLKDVAGFGRIPETKIVDKKILYRSQIYFTPLLDVDDIDGGKVQDIIKTEYVKAGISPKELDTGAIIITGESMRKRNAKSTVEALSQIAGDFVVATAGPDLESVLAGRGSGAAELSRQTGKLVANLDIGGGTTNIACFKDGEVYDTACLDVGARLIKTENGRYTYVSKTVSSQWNIHPGETADIEKLQEIVKVFADLLAQAVGLCPETELLDHYKTNHLITVEEVPELIVFSGGVAACMEQHYDTFAFGDLGVMLAEAIRNNLYFQKADIVKATETMRATVIGAGNFTMDISGSTIEYTETDFPLKSIPIGKIRCSSHADIDNIENEILRIKRYFDGRDDMQIAIAMDGLACPAFAEIQDMAKKLVESFEHHFAPEQKMILIIKEDIGKALGQAILRFDRCGRTLICMDSIRCTNGDYIDIGKPVSGGTVIPVVIKTLIFQQDSDRR